MSDIIALLSHVNKPINRAFWFMNFFDKEVF